MDSPLDSDFGVDGAPFPSYFLGEDQIISSQPVLALEDMLASEEEEVEKRTTEKGKNEKKKAVQKTPLIAENKPKQVIPNVAQVIEKEKEKTNIIEDYKKRAEVAESALEQMKKIVTTTIETHQKRAETDETASVELKHYKKKAEDAAAALVEFKREILAILDADNKELKKRCHDQNVRIFGGAAMKHKYACALLENYID